MGTSLLFCILIGAALCCSVAANSTSADGGGPDNCCFEFYPKRVKIDKLKSYHLTDHRCEKAGVIVITAKNIRLCMDPALPWVKKIISDLDERRF